MVPDVDTADTAAVTPLGAPMTVTVGVALNPPAPVTVKVLTADPPCGALALPALSAMVMVGVVPGATGSSPPHAWVNSTPVVRPNTTKRRVAAMN